MTKKLIQKTRIKSTDGFVVCKLIYEVEPQSFPALLKEFRQENYYAKASATCYYMESVIQNVVARYLRSFCTDSFAVSIVDIYPTEEDNYKNKKAIYVAFRSRKELFKFIMKHRAKRTRWWKSSQVFYYVGKEDDPFEGRHAGADWNYEDPQDMIP